MLVEVIKLADQPDALRYAVPDCWGRFTLDGMSDIERDAYVAEMRASFQSADAP